MLTVAILPLPATVRDDSSSGEGFTRTWIVTYNQIANVLPYTFSQVVRQQTQTRAGSGDSVRNRGAKMGLTCTSHWKR